MGEKSIIAETPALEWIDELVFRLRKHGTRAIDFSCGEFTLKASFAEHQAANKQPSNRGKDTDSDEDDISYYSS